MLKDYLEICDADTGIIHYMYMYTLLLKDFKKKVDNTSWQLITILFRDVARHSLHSLDEG